MKNKLLLFLICLQAGLLNCWGVTDDVYEGLPNTGPSKVQVRKVAQRYELIRNGEPYFINGSGGSAYLDQLVAAGGNSIRSWGSSREFLDQAAEKGLTVCMGLRMHKPRHGANYQDTEMLRKQRERILKEVEALKDHPALLIWSIGNEVEHNASDEDSVRVWREIERIAQQIKQVDQNHPVITVIAGVGKKLEDIQKLCPTLDAIGINSYGRLSHVPSEIQKYNFKKPYIITEFGPRGWWESPKTEWGLPIEETSTEKAKFYYTAYKAAIDNKPNCLGSYVFLWGNKQEKTHTWFNMFLPDGSPVEMIDTMQYLWTGQWPENRAPEIGSQRIYVESRTASHVYEASSKIQFEVEASDPESDELIIKWDLRKDGSDNPSVGGDWEPRIAPIEGAVVSTESNKVVIEMPSQSGNYRLFTYIFDPSGKVATVNLPLRVR